MRTVCQNKKDERIETYKEEDKQGLFVDIPWLISISIMKPAKCFRYFLMPLMKL